MSYPTNFACHFLGVGAVVIHENKVLLVKLSYGRAQKNFLIPGGLVEKGETLEEGLIREVKEETGLDIIPKGIIGIRSLIRSTNKLTDVYTVFVCDIASDPEKIGTTDPEITDVQWVPISEMNRDDVLNYTRIIVEKACEGNYMSFDRVLFDSTKDRPDLIKYSQFWV